MSANLDLVRSIYADWERGDFSRSDWAAPEINYVAADGPEPGTCVGLPGMAEFVGAALSAFEHASIQADEYHDLDCERVLVLDHFIGRSKTSGVDLGQMGTREAHLFHIRRGNVTRLVRYLDRALADLGLEE